METITASQLRGWAIITFVVFTTGSIFKFHGDVLNAHILANVKWLVASLLVSLLA